MLDSAINTNNQPNAAAVSYCERFVDFISELLSQLPTRRFLHAVLEDKALLVKCYLAPLFKHPSGVLFARLIETLRFYLSFPINDHTGDALNDDELTALHYEKVQQLQRLFYKHWPQLKDLALANCGTLSDANVLRKELAKLSHEEVKQLVVEQLRLVAEDEPLVDSNEFLMDVMVHSYEQRRSQRKMVSGIPLYPTEELLFDENQVPTNDYKGDAVLSLPKLNLQFLTVPDYLLRNFYLYRLEAAYEIREDISDALRRLSPYCGEDDATHFTGWSRMATNIEKFGVVDVRKPKVGETRPARVLADIVLQTKHMRSEVKKEWDELKQHDVMFLLTVKVPYDINGTQAKFQNGEITALQAQGLMYVRGCEVIEIRDEAGVLMNDFTGRIHPDEWQPPKGTLRTVTVALDPAQYQSDVEAAGKGSEDVYKTFNLLLRRKAKENNFKSVLECIRDLIGEGTTVPEWLHDILLGYGDPAAADYQNMPDVLTTVDFKDTFLDAEHVEEAFPQYEVEFVGQGKPQRPFKITFPSTSSNQEEDNEPATKGGKRKATEQPDSKPKLLVESYTAQIPGPYPQDIPPQNNVRFTAVQTQAIVSGVQPGLTMVVGPPGTGKTDTAVQIMHILYHNCPHQRTLIITHSNQVWN